MRTCLVSVLLLVLIFNDGGYATLPSSICYDQVARNLTSKLADGRNVVIDSMLNTFTGLTPDRTSLRAVYKAFAKKFARNATEPGYCNFVESLNMISSYYQEANIDHSKKNVTSLAQRFKSAFGTKNSVEICSLFAKLLDINDEEKLSRNRRNTEDCSCPKDGIYSKELLYPCQFFTCLDDGRNLPHVFEGFVGLECLAFVLDTTGSMKDEIDTTIQVIRDLIGSEENGCYILVPFNDNGNSKNSVGPVTLTFVDDADPDSIKSLQTLIHNLENSFRKNSGGDCPEYCYDGIIEAFKTNDDGFSVMESGSQIVVVTDAPSKGLHNATDVIKQANDAEVCIHFFLGQNTFNCFETSPNAQAEYELVANSTGGVVVNSKFEFTSFVQKYRDMPCGFLDYIEVPSKKRRSAAQFCHNFNVSSLACTISVTIKTAESTVTVQKPSKEQVAVNSRGDFDEKIALFVDNHPQPGQWKVCGKRPIEISVGDQKCIDLTPYYIKNETGKPMLTAETSSECTNAHIVVVSARSSAITSPVLEIVDMQGYVVSQSSLLSCDNSMSANITMPTAGTYYYRLRGEDNRGLPFSHLIQRKIDVTSRAQLYSLTGLGPDILDTQIGQVVELGYELNSTNDFGTLRINFEIDEDIQHTINPSHALLSHAEAVRVVVTMRPGVAQQQVTLRAFSDCFALKATRTVRATQPVTTTPMPEACNPACLNGGTCISIRRRSRQFHVCRCAPGYRGRSCERQI